MPQNKAMHGNAAMRMFDGLGGNGFGCFFELTFTPIPYNRYSVAVLPASVGREG